MPQIPEFGYNTGNVLQEILAGQEAKKRQAMLDDVNKQNIESEISSRNDNAATNKFNRESLAADRKSKDDERAASSAEETAMSTWAKSQHSDDPTIQSMYGILAVHPRLGKELLPKLYDQVLQNQGKVKKLVPSKVLHYGNSLAEPVMEPATPPLLGNQPVMVPEGDARELIHESQPTQPRQAPASEVTPQQFYLEEYLDPTDQSKGTKQVPYFETPANFKKIFDQKMSDGAIKGSRKGNLPTDRSKPTGQYDTRALTLYQNSLKNTQSSTPQERTAKLNGFINTISNPKYRADVQAILAHPEARNLPVDTLVKSGALTPDPNDTDYLKNIGNILGVIRGGQ